VVGTMWMGAVQPGLTAGVLAPGSSSRRAFPTLEADQASVAFPDQWLVPP